jgi:hypothetical protein
MQSLFLLFCPHCLHRVGLVWPIPKQYELPVLILFLSSSMVIIILCGHLFIVAFNFSVIVHGRHSENDDHRHHPVFVHGRPPSTKLFRK